MTITENELGTPIILSDEGRALRMVGKEGRSTVTRVALVKREDATNWEDCDYGYGDDTEATEADKDAALRRFGVEVDE